MSDSAGAVASIRSRIAPLAQFLSRPVLVAALYFIGAESAFLVGTLSDKLFAPFWPPNIVLFWALLLVPTRSWWIYLVAAFPAHVLAELHIGMGFPQLLVAFATNCLIAGANAWAMRFYLGGPPWFGNLRRAFLYILITAITVPAIAALVGAFTQIAGPGTLNDYPVFWAQWYASNALGALTLGPVALTWFAEPRRSAFTLSTQEWVEIVTLGMALVVSYALVFDLGARSWASSYLPALLYSPLPLVLWCAVRFGTKGASAAILIVTVVLIWRALNEPSLFSDRDAESNVFALQIFVIGLALPLLLLGASIDEARRAQKIAAESEARMRFAARNANIGFWHLDRSTNDLWLTPECRGMLGLTPNCPITQEAIVRVIHPEDRQAVIDSMRRAIHAGELALNEFRCVLPGGEIKWFLSRSHAERDADGNLIRLSGYFADISARKAAEADAEQQRKELAHVTRVAALGELSGAIAHELNQPLTAILSNAQAARRMLRARPPKLDDIAEALDDIVQEDIRASEVIQRLRKLMKKDESKHETFDINVLIESTLRLLHSELINRRVKVETNLAGDLPAISGDPVQIQQVLINLLMNAADAMTSLSPIRRVATIATRATNGGIEFVVTDRGTGFTREDRQRLFEPFFTTKEHGLGLGLSICSNIISAHSGELRLLDSPNGGVTALVRLPGPGALMVAAK